MIFTVALLQIAPATSGEESTIQKGIRYCKDAKACGADLAVFPELWEAEAVDKGDRFFLAFASAARELEMNIAVTYLQKSSSKPRNSVSIFNRYGECALDYSKTFICDFEPDGCDRNCEAGDRIGVCTLTGAAGDVVVGAMICADREFPETATELMLQGAELIVVPNACTWDALRSAVLQTRAFESMTAIASVNYPAPKANGHSQAWSGAAWTNGVPIKTLLVEANEEEQIVVAAIDIGAIRAFRSEEGWRMLARQRRRDVDRLRMMSAAVRD